MKRILIYQFVIFVIILGSLTTCSFSRIVIRNITNKIYEKGSYFNISGETCLGRWSDFQRRCGRERYKDCPNEKLFPESVSTSNKQKLLFVHVPKTGGGTVHDLLIQEKVNFQPLHLHSVDSQMLKEFNIFLIALRHPVERLISHYYFLHPQYGKRNSEIVHKDFYTCCPTLEDFGNALYERSQCGDIARQFGVLGGACSYVGGLTGEIIKSRKPVFIINQESLIDDLNFVSSKLRWGVRFREPNHNQHVMNKPVPLNSAKTLMQLSGFLSFAGEISLYSQLQRFSRVPLIG